MDAKLLTKKDLLLWVNSLLSVFDALFQVNIKNIEQLANGAFFCQMVDILHPLPRLKKVNWNAKLEHENLANLKILSTSMMEAGLNKNFDASRIANKKGQDILELLQWFRKYFYSHQSQLRKTYDAEIRRNSSDKNLQTSQLRLSLKNNKTNESFPLKKPQHHQKKDLQNNQEDQRLINCLKMNKAIQNVVFDQHSTPNLKIQLIKSLIFKGNISQSKTERASTIARNETNFATDREQFSVAKQKDNFSDKINSSASELKSPALKLQHLQNIVYSSPGDTNLIGTSNCKDIIKIEQDSDQCHNHHYENIQANASERNLNWSTISLKSSKQTEKNTQHISQPKKRQSMND